ncbi:MAG TPA: BTAD domain-containing putative transcriptional regulator [Ilumatobacter sp.]|nr:BTAD domain-containing putative transcriptional regulator [Ilumatobacter sp.]
MLEVRLLGDLEVIDANGRVMLLASDTQRRLTSALATQVNQVVRASALEDDLRLTPGALRTAISRLRRVVGTNAIETIPPGYRLRANVDLVEFTRLITTARSTDDGPARIALESALALWRCQPFPEFIDEPWAAAEAQRLSDMHAAAVADLVVLLLDSGELSTALDRVRALVDCYPYQDRPRALLMRALAQAGRPTDALREFQSYRCLLLDHIGIGPSTALVDLDRHIATSVQVGDLSSGDSPSLQWTRERRPVAARPQRRGSPTTNLPVPVSSCLGRDDALVVVSELCRTNRLVTLTGSGGCGKTRLALAAATTATPSDAFSETWWVELAPLTESSHVVEHVALALGISAVPDNDFAAAIARRIGGRRAVLLILDNAEHVVASVTELVSALVATCPNLSILVTSRERLGISAEFVWRVPSLSVPPPGASLAVADVDRFGAMALLIDRLRSAGSLIVLDDATLAHAATICRGLDGLPFAIELAAARARTLPLEIIARGIEDAIHWGPTGRRVPYSRHTTLHACIADSFEMSSAADQKLMMDLAVLRLPFTVDAAISIGTSDGVSESLSRLVDSSLLEFDHATARFRMLTTVRQFCFERAAAAGEFHAARRRHAQYIADWCIEVGAGVHGIERGPFVRDMPEVVAALEWARSNAPDLVFAICAGLASVRSAMGYWGDAALTWSWLMETDRDGPNSAEWAVATAAMMSCATAIGIDFTDICDEVLERLPDDHPQGRGWLQRGEAMFPAYRGRVLPIAHYADEVVSRGDDIEISLYVGFASYMTALMGQLDQSERFIRELRRLTTRQHARFTVDAVGNGFAAAIICDLARGNLGAPARRITPAIPDDPVFSFTAAGAMAEVALVTMDVELLAHANAWSRQEPVAILRYLPTLVHLVAAMLVDDVERAADLSEQYWDEASVVPVSRVHPLSILTSALIDAGRLSTARTVLDTAERLLADMDPAPQPLASLLVSRARLAQAAGRSEESARHSLQLLELADQHEFLLYTIDALELIATADWQLDTVATGLLLEAAHAQRERIGYRYRLDHTTPPPEFSHPVGGADSVRSAVRLARDLATAAARRDALL